MFKVKDNVPLQIRNYTLKLKEAKYVAVREKKKYEEGIKKSLHQLESNLRYLSILANGAPINKNEDRKIMDFLRTHYDYLQKLSVPA